MFCSYIRILLCFRCTKGVTRLTGCCALKYVVEHLIKVTWFTSVRDKRFESSLMFRWQGLWSNCHKVRLLKSTWYRFFAQLYRLSSKIAEIGWKRTRSDVKRDIATFFLFLYCSYCLSSFKLTLWYPVGVEWCIPQRHYLARTLVLYFDFISGKKRCLYYGHV